jgi:WD40 repeat protein
MAAHAQFPSRPKSRLLDSTGPIHALTYSSPPGTYILTGSADRSIRLYNPFPKSANTEISVVGPSRLIQTYVAHGYEVLDIAVSRSVFSIPSLCFPSCVMMVMIQATFRTIASTKISVLFYGLLK